MQNNYKILLWILTLSLTAGFIGGCGEDSEKLSSDEITAETTAAETTIESGRESAKDTLPDDLDFGGEVVHILTRGADYDTSIELVAQELDGDVLNDAVWRRNSSVEERLNVELDIITSEFTRHNSNESLFTKSILAGADDYDIVANAMHAMVPFVTQGMFVDVQTLDYLDFTQPWWNQAYLEMTEYDGSNYTILGDLSQTMISGAFCMFFNKQLFDEYLPDAPSLYDTVLSGEWTLDKLIEYCSSVYSDVNGNSMVDEGDRFGHYFTDTKTLGADSFAGSSGINLIEKNSDGSYSYNGLTERTNTFVEKMHSLLFENNNTCRLPYNDDTIMTTMINDQTIFTTWMLTGVNYLRDMQSDFGIIPMPKLDENQAEYKTYVHDGTTVFCIPTTTPDADMSAAVLEAMCAETYRTVTPAYFETVLKDKYARDSETSQMLDIIAASVYLDIGYIYGPTLGHPIDAIRTILSSSTECERASSTLASKETQYMTNIEKIDSQFAELKAGN